MGGCSICFFGLEMKKRGDISLILLLSLRFLFADEGSFPFHSFFPSASRRLTLHRFLLLVQMFTIPNQASLPKVGRRSISRRVFPVFFRLIQNADVYLAFFLLVSSLGLDGFHPGRSNAPLVEPRASRRCR